MGNISQKKELSGLESTNPRIHGKAGSLELCSQYTQTTVIPNKGNRRQKRPCVQPSLLNGQGNLAHQLFTIFNILNGTTFGSDMDAV